MTENGEAGMAGSLIPIPPPLPIPPHPHILTSSSKQLSGLNLRISRGSSPRVFSVFWVFWKVRFLYPGYKSLLRVVCGCNDSMHVR